jgi:hypothetical protein
MYRCTYSVNGTVFSFFMPHTEGNRRGVKDSSLLCFPIFSTGFNVGSLLTYCTHTLTHTHCKDTLPKIRNKCSQKRNCEAPVLIFTFLCRCERFIYSHGRSAYSVAGKYVDRSWEYINRSQTHRTWNLGLRPRNSFSGKT